MLSRVTLLNHARSVSAGALFNSSTTALSTSSTSLIMAEEQSLPLAKLCASNSHVWATRHFATSNSADKNAIISRRLNKSLIHHREHHSINVQHNMAFSTSTRRRRRRGGGGSPPMQKEHSEDNNLASSPTALTKEQFLSAATSLLDRVELAVSKLKDSNAGLEIARYPPNSLDEDNSKMGDGVGDDESDSDPRYQQHGGQLSFQVESSGDLYWGGGTYWLTIHPNSFDDSDGAGGTVTLQSPLSGTFTYGYNPNTDEWIGTEDGHSLLGMLTRDWIRQCRGVPDF